MAADNEKKSIDAINKLNAFCVKNRFKCYIEMVPSQFLFAKEKLGPN